jgi:hypothetical protein
MTTFCDLALRITNVLQSQLAKSAELVRNVGYLGSIIPGGVSGSVVCKKAGLAFAAQSHCAIATSSERLARPQNVDGETGNVLRFALQGFGGSGEKGKCRIVHGDDVLRAEKADGVGRFAGAHGEKIADGKHCDLGSV